MNLNREDVLYYAQKLCKKGILMPKGLTPLFKKVEYSDEGSSLGFWVCDDKRWNSSEMAQIVADAFIENDFTARHVVDFPFIRVYIKKEKEMSKNDVKEMVNECFKE